VPPSDAAQKMAIETVLRPYKTVGSTRARQPRRGRRQRPSVRGAGLT